MSEIQHFLDTVKLYTTGKNGQPCSNFTNFEALLQENTMILTVIDNTIL